MVNADRYKSEEPSEVFADLNRLARFTEALDEVEPFEGDLTVDLARAVMAVADAEHAELRAEVEASRSLSTDLVSEMDDLRRALAEGRAESERLRRQRDGAREQRDDLVELVDQLKEGAASAGIHWAQEKRRAEAAERALAEERAALARVSLAALAVAEAWDDAATTEPCGDCLRSGVGLLSFDDDERIDQSVNNLRAVLAGPEPEASD